MVRVVRVHAALCKENCDLGLNVLRDAKPMEIDQCVGYVVGAA